MLVPYKYVVIPVCQQLDKDGNVIGETLIYAASGSPFEVFGAEGLALFGSEFPVKLARAEETSTPSSRDGLLGGRSDLRAS